MDRQEIQHLLEDLSRETRYADFKGVRQSILEMALRSESFEIREEGFERVSCRVVVKGYGVASTDRPRRERLEEIARQAVRQASAQDTRIELAPVRPEKGEYVHPCKKPIGCDEAREFLLGLRALIKDRLGPYYSSSELVLTHSYVESSLLSSEGTDVQERAYHTDLVVYLVVRGMRLGFASKVVGGKGGLEVLENRDWGRIVEELAHRARDATRAQVLSPLVRGRRFKVILDAEATGAVAHEVAHALEGDSAQARAFRGLNISEELEVLDNPSLPGGYGSFIWDDEGVRGARKVLLKRGEVNPLHTRVTARGEGAPGNARGVTHMPRPSISNVYIEPRDWHLDEMFQDTRSGIFVRGVVRAETDLSDGRVELVPEIAYLIENKEVKTPIKGIRVTDYLHSLVQRIDAIGRVAQLRPNIEKGSEISEGGPYIRINGVHCA